jgi:alanyl-tRNA synthetase
MPTEKLYWADPFATRFEATGARLSTFGDRPSLVLDATLFYPEAGGQLADTGEIDAGGARVAIVDVQIDEAGVIHHLALGELPAIAPDAPVHGTLDAARRRDMMAQHTAQHALSRALVDVARAETVSARLGRAACTIDVDKATIADADLAKAEDLVNGVVMDDVTVRQLFPTAEELAKLPLRRAPKVESNVRVIEIEGFDFSPCGGTHCTRTGQIGQVRVTSVEKYKGKMRVSFQAGLRTIEGARANEKVLAALAQEFTCGVLDVGSAVAKLRKDLEVARDVLGSTRGELLELLAEKVLATHPPDPSGTTTIALERPKDDLGMLRALASRLARRADVVAICTSPDPGSGDLQIILQRGENAAFDCGAWLRAKAQEVGGRGGGRPERAEGRLPRDAKVP